MCSPHLFPLTEDEIEEYRLEHMAKVEDGDDEDEKKIKLGSP